MRELDDILNFVVSNIDGAQFATLGSMDGLLIEQVPKTDENLSAYVAEMTNVLTAVSRLSSDTLPAGVLRELMITSERFLSYVRMIGEDLFLTIVMNPSGNLGKARLYSEQAKPELLELLG